MFSRFFIDRPIFASVLSIVITLAGGIAVLHAADRAVPGDHAADGRGLGRLSRRQRPGRRRHRRRAIEQQVNGVEDMMYMSSQCTNDGTYTLTVTFKPGVDLNMAQVLVQNRVVAGRADPARPGQAPRRDGQEEVAQRADDRQPVLARRQPRQPVPEQLRHHPAPRRAVAAAGRRRHHLPRPARLQHAASGSTRRRWRPAT